jgi:hypothetical protein
MTYGEGSRPGRDGGVSGCDRGIATEARADHEQGEQHTSGHNFIAIIPKNKPEDVRISLSKFNEVDLLNVRTSVEYSEDGERGPSKKGLSVRTAQLPALPKALHKAEQEARRRGLIGGDV